VRFHVYYAHSEDGGASFEENQRLLLEPEGDPEDDPCLDYDQHLVNEYFYLGEYIGITVRELGDGEREVWASYTGTVDEGAEDPQESVIWSTRIPWLGN
jgi:hypothetical protein